LQNERLKYFQVLGINPTDNTAAIKKAYRKMAFRYHPDKNASADAHQKFIQITEAYEVLTGQRRPPKQAVQEPRAKPRTEEEIFAEKVSFAKERYRRQQEEEARKDAMYFRAITSGWKWRWFKFGAWYSAIMSFCLTVDYFATGYSETLNPYRASYAFYAKIISAKNENFVVDNHDYWDSDYFGQLRGNRSLLFNDLKSISVVLDPPDLTIRKHSDRMKRLDGFDEYELYTVMSSGSMYGAFPIVHFFLLVPLMLVRYKRPILRFSIWRLVSIYVLFPLAFFLTFSNDRIFHLLGIM
jgi:hypothetical protein